MGTKPLTRSLELSLALTYSDRTEALFHGTERPDGLVLSLVRGTTDEIFHRMLRELAYDAAEMSLAAYTVQRSRGVDDLIAIPAFPSRMFRHGSLYVRVDSPWSRFEDLKGARVGTPDYQMTVGVWVRQLIKEHGVVPTDISWSIGGLDAPSTGERIDLRPPAGLGIERIAGGETLSELLAAGELDALLTPRAPRDFSSRGAVRRLLDDPKAAEIAYFKRSGIFPIMHTVVLRRALYDAHPWVAVELLRSFVRSKQLAWQRLRETDYLPYGLVWSVEAELEQRALFGDEHWPYGVPANRHVLETFVSACHDQGLTERLVGVDELFAPSTLDMIDQ